MAHGRIDVRAPGSGLPGIDDPELGGVLKLGGALRVPRRNFTEDELKVVEAFENWFEPYPHVHFDDDTYRGDAYPAYGWAACAATVDLDLDSGEVTVRDVVAADDVGRVIHPVLAVRRDAAGCLTEILPQANPLEEGAIGQPLGAAATMLVGGPESWHPNADMFYRAGGGPLLDIGGHADRLDG